MYACTRYGTGVGFSFPDVVLLPVMPRLELHTERHTEWHTECAINFAFWKISHFVAIFQLVKSIRKMKSFADGKFRLGKLDILKLGKCEICETILQCAKCDILGKIFHHAKFTTKTWKFALDFRTCKMSNFPQCKFVLQNFKFTWHFEWCKMRNFH